jgi:AraC-like DNA-binding protein
VTSNGSEPGRGLGIGTYAGQRAWMQLLTYSPPASLTPYVEYMWTLRCPTGGVATLDLFANGVSGIIVQSHNGISALKRTAVFSGTDRAQPTGGSDIPAAFVYGKRTRPGQLLAVGPFELAGVAFRPQGLHGLLEIDPAEINNGPVEVDGLLACGLSEQLVNAVTASERLTILARHLRARAVNAQSDDALVNESLRLLRGHVRTIRLPRLLKCLGLSERQFERRFRKAVGLSPHRYLRILRFHEAMRLMRERQFDRMSDLACELNYTDQSHFTKETKELSGHTPTGLLQTVRASFGIPCALLAGPRSSRASAAADDGFLQAVPGTIRENSTARCTSG